jgi:DNA-binding Lrp family transcriptional regulator
MGALRSKAVSKRAYVEIDLELLRDTGEVRIVGDPIVCPEITTKVPRGKFEVVYCSQLFDIMRELGNRKIEVLAWLLDNKDGNNCINETNTQIARSVGVSRPTVIDTLAVLSDAGLITRKNSVIMVSPNLIIKGNQIREAFLMHRFEEMQDEAGAKQYNDIDAQLEGQLELTANGDIVERAK